MTPVSYQWMPSAVNSGHLAFNGVFAIPNVVHYEKPAQDPLNPSCFKKNLYEHTGMGVYRNFVSFKEAESNKQVTQPARKYPLSCPYCGQGYMRGLCLAKHINRLHENRTTTGNVRLDLMAKRARALSNAFPTSSEPPPIVRVAVPTPQPGFHLSKDDNQYKTLDANLSRVAKSNAALLPPLNGNVQHNTALTVSLPNEVSIPAGCVVELVEVKTVNGMKELKLRLFSKEENESVIKDTRTKASCNTTPEKQSSLVIPSTNIAKPVSFDAHVMNGAPNEAGVHSVKHPVAVPSVGHELNQTHSKEVGLKRSSPVTINLDCSDSPPNKLPRSLSPLQINSAIRDLKRDSVNHSTPTTSKVPTVVVNRSTDAERRQNVDTSVSQSAVETRRCRLYEQSSAILPRRLSASKGIPREMPVRLESRNGQLKNNGTPLSICIPAPQRTRTSPVLDRRDKPIRQRFLLPKNVIEPAPHPVSFLSYCTKPKKSIQKRVVKSDAKEPEPVTKDVKSFPVISSVFSLSQQPGDVEGAHVPLVMALRGIVMDEVESPPSTTDVVNDSGGNGKDMPPQQSSPAADSKCETTDPGLLSPSHSYGSVKIESCHKATQFDPPSIHSSVKTEQQNDAVATSIDKCVSSSDSKPFQEDTKFVPNTGTNVISPLKPEPKIEGKGLNGVNAPSKFLIVSLKRVQIGEKYYRGQSLKASKPKQQVCMDRSTTLHLLPLNIDQMVKGPGPNQPVVVLNHPKPRACARGGGADASAHTGTPQAVPKCQILKMRLSKVMGEKYEVKGCTVGVSQ